MVTFVLLFTLCLFILFIISFILIPYIKINSYKQQGVETYFFPMIGFFKYLNQAFKDTGDIMGNAKGGNRKSCKTKFMVSNIGSSLLIILHDPQYIKEFLQNQNLYHKSRMMDPIKILAGTGLFTAEDEVWKRKRKIVSSSFHFDFLKANLNMIQSTAKELINKIPSSEYNNYSAIKRIQEITGEIIGRTYFGEKINEYSFEGKTLTRALPEIAAELAVLGRTLPVVLFGAKVLKNPFVPKKRNLMQRIKDFHKVCLGIINDRKANPKAHQDLLASLLATQKQDDPDMSYSDEDILYEFITFIGAGLETSGRTVAMVLYMLTQYPEYLEELRIEREALYNKELSMENIQKMNALHSFIKETMRFYPSAALLFNRIALKDHMLVDLKINKGDQIMAELIAGSFDERNFENPTKFDPLRWRRPDLKADPYAYLPFSAGPRNCIGQHLAIIMVKVIVSEFLEKFEMKVREGYKLKMVITFGYEPETDIPLVLRPLDT